MIPPRPLTPHKGRGAVSNLQGRYEVHRREGFDDGWTVPGLKEEGKPAPKTIVTDEFAKTILSRNASPDIPFNVSINPYRGCEHGCIYCFARPSHSYLGLSPGLDFESRLFAKVNAADLLRRELAKPGYVPESIAIGVNTDAYQPCERERGITREILQVLGECNHPYGLITKSALIERDIDLIAPMAEKGLATAAITLTTLDGEIARTLEPRAAAPARRLRAIRTLTEAGIPVSVSVAPIIPFITEPEIERILEAAKDAGAVGAHYTVLRMPWEVNPLFHQWLYAHFPDRAQRVLNRMKDMHAGKEYDSDFSKRMSGEGVWADLIRQRFTKAVKRLGLDGFNGRFSKMDGAQFRRPLVVPSAAACQRRDEDVTQLDLFGGMPAGEGGGKPASRKAKASPQLDLF
ncbi:PA0069 family radical SAM protein [Massilia norwichensis]|jgi:DNA repair photolyase|uniref:PA0069 family radical SAM protein n=1 Tax=Massilia norwichensis TaxID=1442366 RepID=A0ABT2A9E0_9BURK|nr:PA0069 family radical SAM protein [Massilia norwichensis]MCS0590777.1 PA0069 family radical SAM protein [Massilia norwichensis]